MPSPRLAGPRLALAAVALGTQVAAALLPAPAPGDATAAPPPPVVPAARLQEDVALLRRVLTELHPGLHRYADEATVARRLDGLAADLGGDTPLDRAYLLLSRFLATIRCGHTYANFWNQPEAVRAAVFGRADKVPFTFRLVDGRMIVTGDLTPDGTIGATAEVLAIGGRRVGDLLAELVTLVKADGGNDAKRLHDLQLSGEGRFEAFDVYQPLVLPPVGGRYALDLADPQTGRGRSVVVAAVSREERARRIDARRGRPAPTPDELWSLRFLDDGTAHLVLGSFVTWQMKRDWKAFLAEAFGAMRARGNPGLVLDVRGNEGGSDEVLLELARYLVWKPVELPARRSLVRYRRLPPDLGAHLDTWDESFRDFGEDAAPRGDGFFELGSASQAGRRLEPGPDAYRGRIVLLVDAANSSATFTLASLLKDGGLATLVGQPTGGSRRGLNGGKIFFLRLPGSGIEVDVPVVGTFPVEEQPDEGVRPDVLVEPSVEDVLAGRDATLAAARAVLAPPPPERLVDLVRPIVGTARKDQAIGAVNSGQTFPAVGVPFGMTHWTPQTQASEDKCVSPFYAQDERIHGIRASHWWSGSCTQDYGGATIAARVDGDAGAAGSTREPEWLEALERGSSFSRADEVMTPAYYAVTLPEHGVRVEATGTARAGILRLTFLRAGVAHLAVRANRKSQGAIDGGGARVDPGRRAIAVANRVQRIYAGSGRPAGFAGHVVARVDAPIDAWGTWGADGVREGSVEQTGRGDVFGGWARLRVREGQVVLVRAGTSFTSGEAAERNLEAEIGEGGFDEVRARAEAAWEEALSRVRVRGGAPEQRQVFYTALYHALLLPRLVSDVDGSYPRFADGRAIERAEGFDSYDDFSLWDTFRAQHPLLVLVQPERVPHLVRSLLAKADQGGFLPNFPAWGSYTTAMIGDHGASVIADAWVKGVRGFDGEAALAALVKNATVAPTAEEYADGRGRRALGEYRSLGFIPLEQEVKEAFHRREQVSRTLEYSYDDFAVAALARALGRTDVAAEFERRSGSWRNVFDRTIGFVRGRHADGRWTESFDPAAEQPWITEGTPWQYSFFVPHDVPGLVEAMGGREAFVARLDRLFAEGRYWHGNEPSHHIAYLYAHAGAPWRTQEEVRRILATEYGLGPAGLRGNDDTGQMSAWYVFSALGFYPVCPGTPRYEIGSPLFEEAQVDVGGGRTFTVRAPGVSAANLYVQSATLDGRPHDQPFLDHADVARGAVLELRMGPRPNPAWGAWPRE